MINFGFYPFPHHSLFSSNQFKYKVNQKFPMYVHNGQHIYSFQENSKMLRFTSSGQFCWDVAPIELPEFESSFPPISIQTSSFLETFGLQISYSDSISEMVSSFENKSNQSLQFDSIDEKDSDYCKVYKSLSKGLTAPKIGFNKPIQYVPSSNAWFDTSSILFSSGLYIPENPDSIQKILLRKTENPCPDLHKQSHKISSSVNLIYVASASVSIEDIALITPFDVSPHFQEFCFAIGWEIDLETYSGYRGKLPQKFNGKNSIYYSDFQSELMFHSFPFIPCDDIDDKMKFIDGDAVAIIYCESGNSMNQKILISLFGPTVLFCLSFGKWVIPN